MSEKFTGLVEVQDDTANPVVRVVLSGEDGSARFGTAEVNSPVTTLTSRSLSIGRKRRRPFPGMLPGGIGPTADTEIDIFEESEAENPFAPKISLLIGDKELAGGIAIAGKSGATVLRLNGATASVTVGGEGNAGEIIVKNANDQERIRLDGTTGDIKLLGADCAEDFDVIEAIAAAEPGTVLVIGEDSALRVSSEAYDRRVAGVVSGAGDYQPGIVLGRNNTQAQRKAIALVGKVFCKVDASYAPIGIGDLLTTSDTPGHAMKAVNQRSSFGAVIGKALRPLVRGQGLIPILVALQ